MTLVTAGRVGKPHGLDGSFYVEAARHALPEGATVTVGSRAYSLDRRAGTDERPLIRLEGVSTPARCAASCSSWRTSSPRASGSPPTLPAARSRVSEPVTQVIDAPSCSVLELEDGTLIPFVSDAVERVDLEAREIRVRRDFLG